MDSLLEMLNHLLAAAIAGQREGGALQIRGLVLDDQGARLIARVDHPAWQGEVVLRLEVEPPQGERQGVRLHLEQVPERLPPALEAFRRVLEKTRLRIDLDFSP